MEAQIANNNNNQELVHKAKLAAVSDDGNNSDTSDLPLHGQQEIQLEFDDDHLAVQTQNQVDQKRATASTSNASLPAVDESFESSKLDFDSQQTRPVNQPASPSKANQIATMKLHSMTQVYDLASSVGTCIEPLSNELGQNRLEPLTKSIIQMLNILETTVQQSNQLQQVATEQLKENAELRAAQDKQTKRFSELEMEYEINITRMSEQLEILQQNHDSVVNDWSFNDLSQTTQVEENLANALRQAHEEIKQLQTSSNQGVRHASKESNTTTSGAGSDSDNETNKILKMPRSKSSHIPGHEADQAQMNELMSVLKEKNYYKQKCFALEDEIRELRGESVERMSLTTTPSPSNTQTASTPNFPAAVQLGQTIGNISQNQLTRKLSTYFRGFVKEGSSNK